MGAGFPDHADEDYHLDPEHFGELEIVDKAALLERRESCCDLVEIAKGEMTNLYQQVAGSGYSILLSDPEGVVLNYVGDPLFTTAAASTGMQPVRSGGALPEGTNGIGTCLAEKRPLVIHKHEHFYTKNTRLTCSAAPIFDPTGKLAGVLDASSESHLGQQHTMVLVNMSTQLIENRLFTCRMRDQYILRFHSRPEFVGTLGRRGHRLRRCRQNSRSQPQRIVQLGLPSVDAVAGSPLEAIFNLRPDEPFMLAKAHPAQPQPLRDNERGKRLFALFQLPMTAAHSADGATGANTGISGAASGKRTGGVARTERCPLATASADSACTRWTSATRACAATPSVPSS